MEQVQKEDPAAIIESAVFKTAVAERDRARAGAVRLAADLEKANAAVAALTKTVKEAAAEARLKERDALRRQIGECMSRAAALERERDAARAEAAAAQRGQAAARKETDLLRQTVELVQAARDTAQKERDMVAAKALEADAKAATLTAELEVAKKAAAQVGPVKTGKAGIRA